MVGVPIGRGFKRGLETKVSKRSVFTPKTLENILQNHLRETASMQMLIHYGVFLKDKQKGKNHDLTVAEYKVQQETKRLEIVAENLDEKQDMLYDTSLRLEQAEKEVSETKRLLSSTKMEIASVEEDLIQIKTKSRETKQKLMAEQEEIKQENLMLKLDTLTLHSDKERLLCDVRKAENKKEQMQARKDGLLEDIGVLDKEFEKRRDFINMLDKLKAILYKLLSMIPIVREFTRLVEEKKDIRATSPYGYTPLGRLLKEYRTPLPRYDRLVIFPEIASWQTSKGEVVPVYKDYNGRGTDYQLAGFWNVQTEQGIKVSEIRGEITPENRICTLEQAEVYMKAVEIYVDSNILIDALPNRELKYENFEKENQR